MKEQIKNLTTNLQLNKQLLAMTETNDSKTHTTIDKVPAVEQQSAYTLQLQARLKTYQEREEAM